MFHILVWGAWSFVWGAKPTKAPPWRRDWAGDEGFVGSFARSRTFLGTQQKSVRPAPNLFQPKPAIERYGRSVCEKWNVLWGQNSLSWHFL